MQPKPNTETSVCVPRDIVLQAAMMRLGNVEDELQAGYNILRKYHKTVTIFGSARTPEGDRYYEAARLTAHKLAEQGYAVITGGGHGIMEAANRGAKEAGGDSVGFNIALPHEQTLNSHTTEAISFSHFAPRKIAMTLYAEAYVYFPGGFGTMDELMEIMTLIETGKTQRAPVILYGSDFWNDLDRFINRSQLDNHLISPGDEQIYTITDDVNEVIRLVKTNKTYCSH
ncbi:Lysine decarboxylase family protein [Candidatus Saccharibacteria bacterium RAAC3_TM7_1]|nr:Lysine decarboxylase family protein [Candidatus Saccharibacteria bacterium RAAC3_TM7_1]HCZ28887.1 TIGR00730 family Rossman fold protein [Candidatus Saccharibacteria bacterium]